MIAKEFLPRGSYLINASLQRGVRDTDILDSARAQSNFAALQRLCHSDARQVCDLPTANLSFLSGLGPAAVKDRLD
jgi:hypothetical protein